MRNHKEPLGTAKNYKEPYGTTRHTYLGKQDERTDGRTNEQTNEQTDSLLELARFYPAAKNLQCTVHLPHGYLKSSTQRFCGVYCSCMIAVYNLHI